MIEINKISKRFGEFVCLSDVTLSIPDGSIYGLIGENGAGKSQCHLVKASAVTLLTEQGI